VELQEGDSAMSINTLKFPVAAALAYAATLGLTACSNSEDSSPSGSSAKETAISVEVLGKTVGDTLVFDMMDSTYDFKIEADGKWRIEDRTRFVQSISQDSGEGNATIQMRLARNYLDRRHVGRLRIVFPEDTSQNKTMTIVQKYKGDYDDNADVDVANDIYVVGFGYNAITGGYANIESIEAEIFDTEELIKKKSITYGSNKFSYNTTSITGSTISDISFNLATTANVEGSVAGFSAEMKSSFDMSKAKKNNYEYALTYINYETQTVKTTKALKELRKKKNMNVFAYYAINGLVDEDSEEPDYPSTNEGFRELISDFGSHVVMEARLGGRIRQAMTADVSKITSSYDMNVFAKAAYKGFVDADASVDTKMKQSFEENRSSLDIRVDILGGDKKLASKLTSKEVDPESVEKWKKSVTDGTDAALIGFSNKGLKPLYELIDESLGPEAKERKQKLKAYMESKQFASDFELGYDCGTVTEIDVPKIEDNDTNTLIKDIFLNGQLVAKATLEFVPLLNIKEKVRVVYPVINNKVRFNLGFYIGDKDHKPARVSWDGTDVSIVEYENMDFGAAKKLYIRGASVTSVPPEGTEPHAGTVEDSYLKSTIFVKAKEPQYYGFSPETDGKDVNHNYPLVKIFNHIWLRENYASTLGRSGQSYVAVPGYLSFNWGMAYDSDVGAAIDVIYSGRKLDPFVPSGWKLPSKEDFLEIEKALTTNGVTNVGTAMVSKGLCDSNEDGCGLVGFALRAEDYGFLVTNSKSYVKMRKSGTAFEYESAPEAYDVSGQIRFYQE
jgi:uncharacterized protein (TIGR02145 family)